MLTVIIPTYNEQENIETCLASVMAGHPDEIIVADGGSSDATMYLAKKAGARVVLTEKGLAKQCNAAAREASGDRLLFLAADVEIEPGYRMVVDGALDNEQVSVGGFKLGIKDPRPVFRLIERGGNWRSRRYQFTLPDQGLFVRKSQYLASGGMDETSLIPFAGVCDALRVCGKFMASSLLVKSSPRKWNQHGVLKTCLDHNLTFLKYRWGVRA